MLINKNRINLVVYCSVVKNLWSAHKFATTLSFRISKKKKKKYRLNLTSLDSSRTR